MYTREDIDRIIAMVHVAKLDFPREMLECSKEQLCQICNGVGSFIMPERVRGVVTKIFSCAEASAAIHDFMYSKSDGMRGTRKKVDDIFLLNAFKECNAKFAWWNFRRYFARAKILAAYDAVRAFGWRSWNKHKCERKSSSILAQKTSANAKEQGRKR